jgi:hypothetical protein
MEQFDLYFAVGVSERAILVVLAKLFEHVTLAILGFVSRRVVELLNFVVRVTTDGIVALGFGALDMSVGNLARVASTIAFVVVIVATGELVDTRGLLTIGAELGLEGHELETEKLVASEVVSLIVVEEVADEAKGAVVGVAFGGLVKEGVIIQFVEIAAAVSILYGGESTSLM